MNVIKNKDAHKQISRHISDNKDNFIVFNVIYTIDDDTGDEFISDCQFNFMKPKVPVPSEDSDMGNKYNVLLLKHDRKNQQFPEYDCYTAIIGDLGHHVANLISSGYSGLIVRTAYCDGLTLDFLRLVHRTMLVGSGMTEEAIQKFLSKLNKESFYAKT